MTNDKASHAHAMAGPISTSEALDEMCRWHERARRAERQLAERSHSTLAPPRTLRREELTSDAAEAIAFAGREG
jgi:hypothetical protein